jgi:hypothetical protein
LEGTVSKNPVSTCTPVWVDRSSWISSVQLRLIVSLSGAPSGNGGGSVCTEVKLLCPVGLPAWVEAPFAGGVVFAEVEGRVVGAAVVVAAEGEGVGQVGVAAVAPRQGVVDVGLPPTSRTPSQWSSGHGEVFA